MKIKADKNERLDKYISDQFEEVARNKIKQFIKDKKIKVNNNFEKASYKLKDFDEIEISDDLFLEEEILAEKMDIKVIFENEDYAIIDKDEDVIVHPAGSIVSNTLVNGLMEKFDSLSDIGGKQRPGIVHRLDKDTTGLMVIAKNNKSHEYLKEQFQDRKVDKSYLAIVHGNFDQKSGTIKTYINRDENNRKKMKVSDDGKLAYTEYEVLKEAKAYSLVKLTIKTGRTHQIRVHMQYINHPILGDKMYGNIKTQFNLDHQLLHCAYLGFNDLDNKYVSYQAKPHEKFLKYQKILNLGD